MDLMMRAYYTTGPASCRATVCSAAGQRANKPILSFVGFHLTHSIPSLSSLVLSPPLPLPFPYPCHQLVYLHSYRPLKSAFPAFPATTPAPIWLPLIRPRMEFLQHHYQPSHRLIHLAEHSLDDRHSYERRSRFPTSEDRFGGTTTPPFGSLLYPSARYDPLGSLTNDDHALARKALCSSFTPPFLPSSVSRGVLNDGTWTTEHPSVHAFLQSPSSRPTLTSRTSAAIYSLAALHVFYSPSHPSYDVFWHPNIKVATATFVHEVVTMKPSPISTTPMTWLGVHDMLWQLTGIQKEYNKLHGGKTSTSPLVPTRRSLRKRKPVVTLIQELSTREPSEVPEPARKKVKTTKSDENEKGGETNLLVAEPPEMPVESKAGPSNLSPTKSTTPSLEEVQGNADATPSPLTITSSLPSEPHASTKDDVAQAGPSRGRNKDTGNKKAPSNATPSRPSTRRHRERSPSFSSGSSTAVSATGNNSKRARSSSASSTSTTVDAETGATSSKGKGKEKVVDAAEVADEETDEEPEKRSTRARRSIAREAGAKTPRKPDGILVTATPSSAEIDKLAAAEAPRNARKRSRVTSSRPRNRKARKS
ncbi:hypothetical protein BJV78DRAFT_452933 [Lactifluus subvellereus]|nr:hypothetical protein BJV78DRAFT_452933 [Lactifluus subvellereus]